MIFRQPGEMGDEAILTVIGRWAALALVIAGLLLLSVAPLGSLGEIRPAFLVMAVYYWTILRPAALPPLAVFLAGAALDLIAGLPFGLNALTLVLAQWVTRAQRRFLLGQPFLVMWMGFALVAAGALGLQWAMLSLFTWQIVPCEGPLMSALVTAALFPLAVVPLAALGRLLAGRKAAPGRD